MVRILNDNTINTAHCSETTASVVKRRIVWALIGVDELSIGIPIIRNIVTVVRRNYAKRAEYLSIVVQHRLQNPVLRRRLVET
ncbi:MAG: hypothetical protein U0670_22585 [Anaerolineae bacterium]